MSRVHVTDQKDMDKFNELSKQKYSDQAIFFLNAFWKECGSQAEKIYDYNQGFIALDTKKDDGCDLDEFYSHKFLETYGETMTALELRNAMRKIDINHDNRMSFLEYLLYRYEQTVEELLIRPQGQQSDELIAALKALSQAREDIRQAEASKIEAEARKYEADIRKKEAEASKKEMQASKAQVDRSRAEVAAIRAGIDSKRAGLEKASQAGGVKGNMAKQELFALNNEDSTELNAAILRAEAAVRKAEVDVKIADEAVHRAADAVKKSEDAVENCERAVRKAEEGVQKAEKAVERAQSIPDKNSPGMMWFLERELEEARKYQPRGGIQKADKFKHL